MKLLYEIALHFLALFFLLRKKSWRRLKARLGIGFPKVEKEGRQLIWVHAVSLGETKAVAPLVKKLQALENSPKILLTTATETGFEEGKRAISADYHAFLPWDVSYIIRKVVKKVCPDVVILTETDFWINFQEAAVEVGAKLILVNGKVSKRSFERFLRFPMIARKVLAPFEMVCVQSAVYKRRFAALGVEEEKIVVTGNIKLDGFTERGERNELPQLLGLEEGDLVFTLGSTHDPEEKILLFAVRGLFQYIPKLKVLLVPRHPERFDAVEALLKSENFISSRLTKKTSHEGSQVILIDQMGLLRKCYEISQLAFVGGSFTPKVGGHNILEPCSYGVPVLFGPYMQSQPDFFELVKTYQAGTCVKEEVLKKVIHQFLSDGKLRRSYGENGLRLICESKGALDKTMELLITCVKKSKEDTIFSLSRDGAVVSSLGS